MMTESYTVVGLSRDFTPLGDRDDTVNECTFETFEEAKASLGEFGGTGRGCSVMILRGSEVICGRSYRRPDWTFY